MALHKPIHPWPARSQFRLIPTTVKNVFSSLRRGFKLLYTSNLCCCCFACIVVWSSGRPETSPFLILSASSTLWCGRGSLIYIFLFVLSETRASTHAHRGLFIGLWDAASTDIRCTHCYLLFTVGLYLILTRILKVWPKAWRANMDRYCTLNHTHTHTKACFVCETSLSLTVA